MRFDDSRLYAGFVSPRAALVYRASARTTYKFLYGRAFRNPNAYEAYYGDGVTEIGNASLHPERAETFEADVDRKLSKHWTGVLNAYHYQLGKLIEAVTTPEGLLQYQNAADGRADGVSAELSGKPAPWIETTASVALQHSEIANQPWMVNSPGCIAKWRAAAPLAHNKLWAAARLVDLMGGRIWVESRPGEGSVFHFTMRAARVPEPASAIEPGERRLAGLRVLIVDDNAMCRGIVAESCARWGLHADLADGASRAIEMMRQARAAGRPYDLVLLDARMPEVDGFAATTRIREDSELNGAALILMLDSCDLPDNSARCRALGVVKYLVKPIMPSDLKEAILVALGLEVPKHEQHQSAAEVSVVQTLAGRRVLVAEDHPVNRKLVSRLLEKRSVVPVLASDGNEVLRALESDTFDLILMDVQMPAMDGLQTTAAIRERERRTGGHVPILAMTAHAMDRDRERCLEAGMDAYVTKPVSPEELYRAIDDLLAKHGTVNSSA